MPERPLRPRIGLTCLNENNHPHLVLRRAYVDAVVRAGGCPIVLPIVPADQVESMLPMLDGLILTGGEDVSPLLYGRQPDLQLGAVDVARDHFELALTRLWLATEKPLMGICRGIQLLAVAEGGALVQDLPSRWPGAIRHGNNGPRSNPTHEIEVEPGSLLARLLETDGAICVNSIHHQAIEGIISGYRVSAKAPDGVIEAIEAADGRPVFGVQWHPEEMMIGEQPRLFSNFVKLAAISRRLPQAHTSSSLREKPLPSRQSV